MKGEGENGGRTGRKRREGFGLWLKEKPLEFGSKILSLPLWSEIILQVFVSWDCWPRKNSKWVLSFIVLAGQTGTQNLGIRWRENSFIIDRISLLSCVCGQAVCPWDVLTLCWLCGHPVLAALPCRHCCYCLDAQSRPALCNHTGCSPLGSSVHGISQARILERVAISFSRESSWPRDRTHVSCIGRRIFFYPWATWEAQQHLPYCVVVVCLSVFPTWLQALGAQGPLSRSFHIKHCYVVKKWRPDCSVLNPAGGHIWKHSNDQSEGAQTKSSELCSK